MVREMQKGFQDVVFLPTQAISLPHFIKIVAEVNAPRQPYVLRLVVGGSKGMLPVKCFSFYKASFVCHSNFMEIMRL